jgi:hypothetical protein
MSLISDEVASDDEHNKYKMVAARSIPSVAVRRSLVTADEILIVSVLDARQDWVEYLRE